MGVCGNQDLPESRVLQRFRSIVDEIYHHASEQPAVGANRRQILSKRRLERDAIEASGEHFHCLMNNGVGIRRHKLGGREAHELRELVNQSSESGDLTFDQPRTFLDELSQFRVTSGSWLGGLVAVEES